MIGEGVDNICAFQRDQRGEEIWMKHDWTQGDELESYKNE